MQRSKKLLYLVIIGAMVASPMRIEAETSETSSSYATSEANQIPKDAYTYPNNVVAELGTGTWCGWCVRSLGAFAYYSETYKESETQGKFIPIAIHNGDQISLIGYTRDLALTEYPSMKVNRVGDPIDPLDNDIVAAQFERPAYWQAQIADVSHANGRFNINFNLRCGYDNPQKEVRYAVVLTEENLGPYYQSNNYYKPTNTLKAKLPTWVMPYMEKYFTTGDPFLTTFNYVAQTIYPDYYGTAISADWTANEFESFSASVYVPSYVKNINNVTINLLILESEEGEIIASDSRTWSELSGICDANNDSEKPYELRDSDIYPSAAAKRMELHTIDGCCVYAGSPKTLSLARDKVYVLIIDGNAWRVSGL